MTVQDRSFSDVFQDILHNVQEIIRSEVRLAKTEVREEAVKAKSSVALLGGGTVAAMYAQGKEPTHIDRNVGIRNEGDRIWQITNSNR